MDQESVDKAFAALTKRMSAKQITSIDMSAHHTIALWIGAVSAGKTYASLIAFLIAITKVPEHERIVIVGVTQKTIEGNVITPLKDPKRFGRLSKYVIHTPGASTAIILGRVVELIGAPNALATSKITGATIALAYVDEAVLIPEAFFDMLETRLRVAGARMLATTNPASSNHWLRIKYILQPDDHDMVTFYFQMKDNPSLERSYVLRMIRANVGMFFQRFILGLWTNAAGAIYDMWDPAIHVVEERDLPRIDRILGVGIDYGASHATSAIMIALTAEVDARGKPAPRLVLLDEWRHLTNHEAGIPSMAPSDMVTAIKLWKSKTAFEYGQPNPQMVFVDPSAKGFRDEFHKARVATTAADNDVTRGIADIMSLLTGPRPRLIVSSRCTGWLSEVTEYAWDAKKTKEGLDVPVEVLDDSMDAGRYAVFSTRAFWVTAFKRAYGLAA